MTITMRNSSDPKDLCQTEELTFSASWPLLKSHRKPFLSNETRCSSLFGKITGSFSPCGFSAMVSGQKGCDAEALLPTPAQQVEQEGYGWSWWDGEVWPVPGNAALSSTATQHQAALPVGTSPALDFDLVCFSTL